MIKVTWHYWTHCKLVTQYGDMKLGKHWLFDAAKPVPDPIYMVTHRPTTLLNFIFEIIVAICYSK